LLRGGRRLLRGGRGLRLTRRRSAWTVFLQGRSLIGDVGLLARPRGTVQVHDPDLEAVGGVRGGDHVRVDRLLPGRDALREQAGLRRHRSEEHTSELQSRENLICRLLLEKKK